jgi:tetratricopeptide (TPR) repeat protein
MLMRDSAILKLLIFGLMAFIVIFTYWGEESAARPGWLLMAAALIGLLLLFDLPNLIRRNSSLGMLLNGLDQSIAIGDHERAEELLNVARRRLGLGKSKMHQHLDLAEGTMNFREGRYEQALESLERCFLNAFAVNDSKYGTQSGLLLLKTLVALGRYNEASEFGMGVRQLSDAPEVEHLVALANNRKESLVSH